MGWAARAARAPATSGFVVKRWTDFTWTERQNLTDAKANLERAAELAQQNLTRHCTTATVTVVSVKRKPQLLFTVPVRGVDRADARRRALHIVQRTLSATKVSSARNGVRTRRVALVPPWGHIEVAEER